MKAYIDGRPDKDDPPQFEAPGNIVFLAVDKATGAVLPADTPGSITEAFISGTQPGANAFTRQPYEGKQGYRFQTNARSPTG